MLACSGVRAPDLSMLEQRGGHGVDGLPLLSHLWFACAPQVFSSVVKKQNRRFFSLRRLLLPSLHFTSARMILTRKAAISPRLSLVEMQTRETRKRKKRNVAFDRFNTKENLESEWFPSAFSLVYLLFCFSFSLKSEILHVSYHHSFLFINQITFSKSPFFV